MSQDLKLRPGMHDANSWECPSCGQATPHGSVICISCGYDKRVGRRINVQHGGRIPWGRIVGIAIGLGIVGVGASMLLTKLNKGDGPMVAPGPKMEAPPATAPTPALSPAQIASNAAAAAVSATNAVVSTNEMVDLDAVASEEPVTAARESLARRVDQRFPLFAEGEQVGLRLTNGMMRRGTFGGVDSTDVLLVTGDETGRLPLVSLDIGTRLRVDQDYRVRYVDYWSQRGAKKTPGPGEKK
ncbi:MAG TPA: hypothetical protein VIH35_00700 [Kiritimatiellia bacterium]|jgi:hypothetical protein